jgi:hypothetical protein
LPPPAPTSAAPPVPAGRSAASARRVPVVPHNHQRARLAGLLAKHGCCPFSLLREARVVHRRCRSRSGGRMGYSATV